MSADDIVLINIWISSIACTSFVFLYPFLSPGWWRTWIGRALLTSSVGLALLLDLSLVSKLTQGQYVYWDSVRVIITTIITAGTLLKLTALLSGKINAFRRLKRANPINPSNE